MTLQPFLHQPGLKSAPRFAVRCPLSTVSIQLLNFKRDRSSNIASEANGFESSSILLGAEKRVSENDFEAAKIHKLRRPVRCKSNFQDSHFISTANQQ